jgi:hypothetical protein
MRKSPFVKSLCVSILLVMLVFVPSTGAFNSWSIQKIDDYAYTMFYGTATALAVDANNTIHIAYTSWDGSSTGNLAVYATYNGTSWIKQVIANHSDIQCLALDDNGVPNVIYYDEEYGYFIYAKLTGTTWSTQNTGIREGHCFSLAFDTYGNSQFVFTTGYSDGVVKYANWTGTTWDIQDVGKSSEYELSLALDSNNKPYILYTRTDPAYNLTYSCQGEKAKIATYENNAWKTQTVPLIAPTIKIGNIVVDSENNLHFICTQRDFVSSENGTIVSKLQYVSWNGSAWVTQEVDSKVQLERIGQLVLDRQDNPHFVYLTYTPDGTDKSLYASWTGNAWDIQTIMANETITACGKLSLDNNGNPQIISRGSSPSIYFDYLYYINSVETTEQGGQTPLANTSMDFFFEITAIVSVAIVIIVMLEGVWRKKRHNLTTKK